MKRKEFPPSIKISILNNTSENFHPGDSPKGTWMHWSWRLKHENSFVIAWGFVLDHNRLIRVGRYSLNFKAAKFDEILLAVEAGVTKFFISKERSWAEKVGWITKFGKWTITDVRKCAKKPFGNKMHIGTSRWEAVIRYFDVRACEVSKRHSV